MSVLEEEVVVESPVLEQESCSLDSYLVLPDHSMDERIAAARRNTWLDVMATTVGLFGISMPAFFFGLLLILVVSVWLRLLPVVPHGPIAILLPALSLGLIEAAPAELWLSLGRGIAECQVALEHGNQAGDHSVGRLKVCGSDEVKVVGRGVVLGEGAELAALEEPDGQVEAWRAVLPLVVSVRRKVEDCGLVP